MDALREAMATDRRDDSRWQHAAVAVTADAVDGVPHLVFPTGEIEPAAFVMGYVPSIDTAIAVANTAH
jgi:hypothetical protein